MGRNKISQLMVMDGEKPLAGSQQEFEESTEALFPLLDQLSSLMLSEVSKCTDGDAHNGVVAEAVTAWQAVRTTARTLRLLWALASEWYGWAGCATTPGGVQDSVMDEWTRRIAEKFTPVFIEAINS